MENAQLSGGAMLVLGIIIAIVIVLIPAFIYIYAWIAAILLIIGGLVSLMTEDNQIIKSYTKKISYFF